MLSGTPETCNDLADGGDEYGHISVAQQWGPAQYGLIKFLHESLPLGQPDSQADCIEAIVVAADMIIKLTAGKAYGSRRIILVSDFAAGEDINGTGMDQIRDQMKGTGVSLDLISATGLEPSKLQAFITEQLVEPLEGQVYELDEALMMLSELGSKRARQVATFRGTLDLAVMADQSGGLQIPIAIYPKTMASKLPSASKLTSEKATVERSLEYRRVPMGVEEDPEASAVMPVIPKEDLIQAYRYGRTLVPFSRIDKEAMAYKSEKVLAALGFVSQDSIDRAAFMSAVWLVVPEADNQAACTAMTALVQACWEKETAILARYVRAKGNTPKLVALLPKIKPAYAGFLMVALPYAEDLRRFTFPSLQSLPSALQPTDEQCQVMKDWIKAMSLADSDELRPATVPNPTSQRLIQCILTRVQDPSAPIPPVDPAVQQRFTQPPEEIATASTSAFAAVRGAFELRRVEKWKHAEITRFWETETLKPGQDRPEPQHHISQDTPIEDFNRMVSDRHNDLVVPAFKQMMALIPELAASDKIDLAIECLKALRSAAIKEDEHNLFNAYLQELKRARSAYEQQQDMVNPAAILWDALILLKDKSDVTLISSSENPGSLIPPDHAQFFYE